MHLCHNSQVTMTCPRNQGLQWRWVLPASNWLRKHSRKRRPSNPDFPNIQGRPKPVECKGMDTSATYMNSHAWWSEIIWFNISLQKLCDGNTLKVSFIFMPIFRSLSFHNIHISRKWKPLCCKRHSRQKFQLSLLKDVFHNCGRNSLKLHLPQAKSNVPEKLQMQTPRNALAAEFPPFHIHVNRNYLY